MGFHIDIGGDAQPDSGFAIVIGTTVDADEGALLEFELPCCLPPGTTLFALVGHNEAIVAPAGWEQKFHDVGDDGIFADGYAYEVDASYEGGTLAILSLIEQELQGALLILDNVRIDQLLGAQVEHAPFTATLEPAAPPIESDKITNTVAAMWITSSAAVLAPPDTMEEVDSYSSAEVSTRSILVAHRRASEGLVIDPGVAAADTPVSGRAFSIVISYSAELNAIEQSIYDFGKGALPPWMPEGDEFLMGSAKLFARVHGTIYCLFHQTLIGKACGPTRTTPDWLDQHARDRGTGRRSGESNAALRARLKNQPDALTRDAILTAINAVLEAAGVTGEAALLELPRDAAYTGEYTEMSGTGGTFVQDGTASEFTPDVLPWPAPPFRDASVFPVLKHQLTISGAAEAGNDGTNEITALDGDAAIVENATGVSDVDATADWIVERLDGDDNVTDGFSRSYTGRGYRCCSTRPFTLIVILPFGTTEGIASGITELLRTKKAAGFRVIVERRQIAP